MKLKMTIQEFEKIEDYPKEEYLTFNHFETLLNPYLKDFKKNYPLFSKGQKVLYCISTFGGQVNNGGIFQFFQNKPYLIDDTRIALKTLNETEMLNNFDKAFQTFDSPISILQWIKIFYYQITNKVKAYIIRKEGTDLDWFDDYFYENDKNLERSLLKYIKNNPFEFIEK
jgi:Domain of unknown function (DUF4375)